MLKRLPPQTVWDCQATGTNIWDMIDLSNFLRDVCSDVGLGMSGSWDNACTTAKGLAGQAIANCEKQVKCTDGSAPTWQAAAFQGCCNSPLDMYSFTTGDGIGTVITYPSVMTAEATAVGTCPPPKPSPPPQKTPAGCGNVSECQSCFPSLSNLECLNSFCVEIVNSAPQQLYFPCEAGF